MKGDGVRPVSVKYIDNPKDLPFHAQMQCDEKLQMIFVESGKICVAVDDSTYDVSENSVIIYNAHTSHKEIPVSDAPVKLRYLSVDGVKEPEKPLNHLIGGRDLPFVFIENYKTVKYFFDKIYDELVDREDDYMQAVYSLVNVLFIVLKREIGKERFELGSLNQSCRIVKDYIDQNYNKEICIEDLAAMVYVSTYGLVHQFKRVAKISPIQYQIHVRITEAKKYLLATSYSIREIGETVGYPDGAYFSQIFKKHTGYSPQRYREKFGIGD